jgi:phosphohistidine phosphatase SixA
MAGEHISEDQSTSRTMRKIAVVRHGEYDQSFKINETGRLQMQKIGTRLKSMVEEGETTLILSSTASQAYESALLLADIIGAPIERHEVLWSENSRPENFEAAYQLVQSVRRRADLILVATHYEYAIGFMPYIIGKEFGEMVPSFPTKEGEGVFLDYRKPEVIFLNRRYLDVGNAF